VFSIVEVVTRAALELVCSFELLLSVCLSVPAYVCVCMSLCMSVCVCPVKRRRYDECELFDDKSRDALDVNTDHPGDITGTPSHQCSCHCHWL